MKRVGWFFLCLVPMIAMMVTQIAVEFLFMLGYSIIISINGRNPSSIGIDDLMSVTMPAIIASQIVVLAAALLIYVLAFRNRKFHPFKSTFSWMTIPALLMFMIGFSIIVTCLLNVVYSFMPELIEAYEEMMEASGLTDMSIVSTISTVILAPVSEELVYRGITLSLAHRVSRKFWVANTIQALCFGVAHGNIVQGTYAFALGFVFGCIYKSYNNIIIPMICHMIFNFTGTYLVTWLFGENDYAIILRFFVVLLIALAVSYLGFFLMHYKEKNREENRRLYDMKAQYIFEKHNSKIEKMVRVPVNYAAPESEITLQDQKEENF